jgi:ribA/ribD-fused uncharacterized protein
MNRRDDFVFFWSGPYSQWYPSVFALEGRTYNCAEQYMMYCKAKLFGDHESARQIYAAKDPAVQKQLGRAVAGFDEDTWKLFREGVVFQGSLAKYSQNEDLHKKLLATGTRTLVEASPKDRVWGIGLGEDDPRALNPQQWQGQNLLGIALMRVRCCLRGDGKA